MQSIQPLFCLLGPTASGKTNLAIQLAHFAKKQYSLNIEIISLDSALIYADMNIGTAKPTITEMQGIKHHLIDILTPLQIYNVGDFLSDVARIVLDCKAKQSMPIIVGGTMLYHHSLAYGLHDLPEQNLAIRTQINQEATQNGWPYLHTKLMQIDALSAAKINCNDAQRIQRALEIYYISGHTAIHFHQKIRAQLYTLCNIALAPPRPYLHQCIEQRFKHMLMLGFVDEVKNILIKYPALSAQDNAMRCVGYRQAYAYLQGYIDYQTFIDTSIANTRQLAKRQMTWLKKTSAYMLDSSQKNTYMHIQAIFSNFMQHFYKIN
jgi:tRNA dimethylallyltransferase